MKKFKEFFKKYYSLGLIVIIAVLIATRPSSCTHDPINYKDSLRVYKEWYAKEQASLLNTINAEKKKSDSLLTLVIPRYEQRIKDLQGNYNSIIDKYAALKESLKGLTFGENVEKLKEFVSVKTDTKKYPRTIVLEKDSTALISGEQVLYINETFVDLIGSNEMNSNLQKQIMVRDSLIDEYKELDSSRVKTITTLEESKKLCDNMVSKQDSTINEMQATIDKQHKKIKRKNRCIKILGGISTGLTLFIAGKLFL